MTQTPSPALGWSVAHRLGYGALAALPGVLLAAAAFAGLTADATHAGLGPAAELLYVHVVSQFLVLALFGDLLMKTPSVRGIGRVAWAAFFLTLAPAAVVAFWYVHVWSVEEYAPRARVSTVALPHS